MSFGSILFILIIGGGLAILSFLSFRRGLRHFLEMRTCTTREAAKNAFTYAGFFLFLGLLLAILFLLVAVLTIGMFGLGDSAEEML